MAAAGGTEGRCRAGAGGAASRAPGWVIAGAATPGAARGGAAGLPAGGGAVVLGAAPAVPVLARFRRWGPAVGCGRRWSRGGLTLGSIVGCCVGGVLHEFARGCAGPRPRRARYVPYTQVVV